MTKLSEIKEYEKKLSEAVGFRIDLVAKSPDGFYRLYKKDDYIFLPENADLVKLWNHALSLSEENARLRKERDEALDVLWRDIDDLRDPKLTLFQVAVKIANGIYWRNMHIKKLEARAEAAEAKLSGEKYPNLDAAFLAAMNEIDQYGFDKYREESFQHKRLTGDRTRHMERIYPDSLSLHAIEHFEMYLRGEIHDHFKTLKHQLAAVAFNAMMEFYFAGLGELPSPPTEGKDK